MYRVGFPRDPLGNMALWKSCAGGIRLSNFASSLVTNIWNKEGRASLNSPLRLI